MPTHSPLPIRRALPTVLLSNMRSDVSTSPIQNKTARSAVMPALFLQPKAAGEASKTRSQQNCSAGVLGVRRGNNFADDAAKAPLIVRFPLYGSTQNDLNNPNNLTAANLTPHLVGLRLKPFVKVTVLFGHLRNVCLRSALAKRPQTVRQMR